MGKLDVGNIGTSVQLPVGPGLLFVRDKFAEPRGRLMPGLIMARANDRMSHLELCGYECSIDPFSKCFP